MFSLSLSPKTVTNLYNIFSWMNEWLKIYTYKNDDIDSIDIAEVLE